MIELAAFESLAGWDEKLKDIIDSIGVTIKLSSFSLSQEVVLAG